MEITFAVVIAAIAVLANICTIIDFTVSVVNRWKAKHIKK